MTFQALRRYFKRSLASSYTKAVVECAHVATDLAPAKRHDNSHTQAFALSIADRSGIVFG